GKQRDHNEDAVEAGPLLTRADDGTSPWYLLAVADGVGGYERGEWASQTAIRVLKQQLPHTLDSMDPADALRAAFAAANTAVIDGASATAGRHPARMATTLVAALLRHGTAWWAHVGDSRAYLVRHGQVQRLTEDHSWVEEQVRAGVMSRDEALISERRHAITRSIGFETTVQVDTGGPLQLRSGDVVILCSDGLHGEIDDAELAGVVQQLLPEEAAERLVALSNERGGRDNISV